MPIVTDHFTVQGHSLKHLECGCQDYAYSFQSGDLAVALVSDGCSSAPNSDVGARLLVLTAGSILREWLPDFLTDNPDVSAESLKVQFETLLISQLDRLLGVLLNGSFLGPLFMDATLLIAVSYGKRSFLISFGDGFFAVDFYGDNFMLFRHEFTATIDGRECSAPYYLSYKLGINKERWSRYLAANPRRENDTWLYLDGAWIRQPTIHDDPKSGVTNSHIMEFATSQVRNLIVSTDGIASFDESKTRFIEDIVEGQLRLPPNLKGAVLKRKLLFNASRVWPKNGWKHQDDLGMAGILKQ